MKNKTGSKENTKEKKGGTVERRIKERAKVEETVQSEETEKLTGEETENENENKNIKKKLQENEKIPTNSDTVKKGNNLIFNIIDSNHGCDNNCSLMITNNNYQFNIQKEIIKVYNSNDFKMELNPKNPKEINLQIKNKTFVIPFQTFEKRNIFCNKIENSIPNYKIERGTTSVKTNEKMELNLSSRIQKKTSEIQMKIFTLKNKLTGNKNEVKKGNGNGNGKGNGKEEGNGNGGGSGSGSGYLNGYLNGNGYLNLFNKYRSSDQKKKFIFPITVVSGKLLVVNKQYKFSIKNNNVVKIGKLRIFIENLIMSDPSSNKKPILKLTFIDKAKNESHLVIKFMDNKSKQQIQNLISQLQNKLLSDRDSNKMKKNLTSDGIFETNGANETQSKQYSGTNGQSHSIKLRSINLRSNHRRKSLNLIEKPSKKMIFKKFNSNINQSDKKTKMLKKISGTFTKKIFDFQIKKKKKDYIDARATFYKEGHLRLETEEWEVASQNGYIFGLKKIGHPNKLKLKFNENTIKIKFETNEEKKSFKDIFNNYYWKYCKDTFAEVVWYRYDDVEKKHKMVTLNVDTSKIKMIFWNGKQISIHWKSKMKLLTRSDLKRTYKLDISENKFFVFEFKNERNFQKFLTLKETHLN
ncbi:glycine-rich cell wall structural protein 1.0-like [Anaeramoeba flamelloides]|uniref:Glycine-rich cell wall structural protein 1.0-like n=1 Tax=Anaeramoeba flamelloides TaxID=1746091 RepID=A0AAV8A021_9EUKA|nr:glycine-rich cell wall structural protein 1.0-like [Anaeramoeba flamelloides]